MGDACGGAHIVRTGWLPVMTRRAPHESPRQWLVIALLLLALVSEGYDLQAASFAAPSIVADLGITAVEIGPMLSASLLGVLLGAIAIGPLGDRLGRKRLIVSGCFAYGAFSLMAAAVNSLWPLILLRLLVGVALGGVLPNALALAGEVVRPGREAMAAALIGIGITFGGMLAGLAAAALLPVYGWRAMFVVGGILPLFIAGLLQWSLAESPAYLAYRGEQNGTKRGGGGVVTLFRNGMAAQTLAIWLIFMAVLMCVYLLTGWIPLLLTQEGFSVEKAALVAAAYQGGGVLGGVVASLLLQRRGWDIVAFFALFACMSLLFLVWNPGSTVALVSGVISTGFFVTGMQNAINGAGGVSYPPPLRANGLGWALGVGRIGSIGGPLLGSLAIVLGMSEARQLFALALPPLGIAALAALWLSRNAKI